jgi:negative regulator of sigma E activity
MRPERGRDEADKSENKNIDERGERNRMRRMPPPPREMRNPEDIWREDTQLLLRNYTVDVAFGEPIAGQNTYLLTINPKVDFRPRKKVWLDAQHYIILRMEHYDIDGNLKALSVYTTIDYDSASVAQQLKQYLEKEQGRGPDRRRPYQSEEISIAEAEKQFGVKLPQPSYLPVGFQLQSTSMVAFRGNPSIHFRYTDGLTALSLFVSKVSDESEERQPRPGRGDKFRDIKPTIVIVKNTPISIIDQGHIRILRWEVNNLRFVLIGEELSQEEMVKVAESLVS